MGQSSSKRRRTSEYQTASSTEELITCPIDFERFQNPVITPCGHTFCQSCLNASLRARSCCPLCRQPISSRDIRKNTALGGDATKFVSTSTQRQIEQDNRVTFCSPLPRAVVCPVHHGLLEQPVVASCGHTFCATCIPRKCPECRRSIQRTGSSLSPSSSASSPTVDYHNLAVGSWVQALPVKCEYVVEPPSSSSSSSSSTQDERSSNGDTPRRDSVQTISRRDSSGSARSGRNTPSPSPSSAVARRGSRELRNTLNGNDLVCEAVITFSERENHKRTCQLAPVQCPHSEQCRVHLRAADLSMHREHCRYLPCPSQLRTCRFRGNARELERHLAECANDHFREVEETHASELGDLRSQMERRLAAEKVKMKAERARLKRFRDRSAVFFILLGMVLGHLIVPHLPGMAARGGPPSPTSSASSASSSPVHLTPPAGDGMGIRAEHVDDSLRHDTPSGKSHIDVEHGAGARLWTYLQGEPGDPGADRTWGTAGQGSGVVHSLYRAWCILHTVLFAPTMRILYGLFAVIVSLLYWVLSTVAFLLAWGFSLVRQTAQIILEMMVLGLCCCIVAGAVRGRRSSQSAVAAGAAASSGLLRLWDSLRVKVVSVLRPNARLRTSSGLST
eukprot:TRINITY_DN6470_c0_g1_i1.p1 TRINITY_DN6470_c0_g1~~TRINITY_DN6470_c0_g1_i1.p1  ORF type:complete len:620 (+),score=31.35 TRINITY_DN6470_c0_g1_i1:349-2208(+)